jgi:hypothetical protein
MNVKRRPIGILPIYNIIELALWSWLISVVILLVAFVVPRLRELPLTNRGRARILLPAAPQHRRNRRFQSLHDRIAGFS